MRRSRPLLLILVLCACIVPAAAQQDCTLSITACHWHESVCTGLSDASFRLCRSDGTPLTFSPDDGTWQSSPDGQTVLTTDSNGTLRLTGLSVGRYYLQQTKAPRLYAALCDPLALDLLPDGSVAVSGHTVRQITILHRSGQHLVAAVLLWLGALTPIAVRSFWLLCHSGRLKNRQLWQISQTFFRFCRKLSTIRAMHLYRRRIP